MSAPDALADALLAARLCAVDPLLGGIVLRGEGEARDAVADALRAALGEAAPMRRLPAHIDDARLLGGLDLTATLAQGRAVPRAGLLAEADGGAVIVPMAERLGEGLAARIAAVLDSGEAVAEREGLALRTATRFVLLLFDDSREEDEAVPPALAERAAFRIDLTAARLLPDWEGITGRKPSRPDARTEPESPKPGGPAPAVPADMLQALAATAAALGIDSLRAPLLALRAARAAAALAGRDSVTRDDVTLAARLVLAPRATRIPAAEEAPAEPPPPPPPTEDDQPGDDSDQPAPQALAETVLEAALAALPPDLLAALAAGDRRGPMLRARGAGARRRSPSHGRPLGARRGLPGGGLRLSLIDTLRAAAPWQRLRGGGTATRIRIRADDLHVRRYETRAEAVTIFAVDASGSSALARLAEAKGAVELLLAEAYVKRAQVALIAFRGTEAEVLLPPTRSLTRARRALAALPGGGGTPLAAGLGAARTLGEAARARGRTPFLVILTDGRANIAADGSAVRSTAATDAEREAVAIRAAGLAAAFVDISARPRPEGAALAQAMGARYLPLPRADATALHAALQAAQP